MTSKNACTGDAPPELRVYCNRTLNMRSIRAIGYDMDYTLVHYKVEEWERRAYAYLKDRFLADGWPIENLSFDPNMVCRGLVVDIEKGNLLKTNRFGFVKRALHGTKILDFDKQRLEYSRVIVDLTESRWVFLNTLFSLSEGCMYAQLVDLLDARKSPVVMGYAELYARVRQVIDEAHMEGRLKAEIIADPDRFVIRDQETALALLDQHYAGKKLMLITNSEWTYTEPMMSYAFNSYLPKGMSWRDLFEIVIVSARKPDFFTTESPFFEVLPDSGLLRPLTSRALNAGTVYLGGSARQVEKQLGLSGDEILYVGDHMFGDVQVTKNVLRWRTALVLRELEEEIRAVAAFRPTENKLIALMDQKERIEAKTSQIRVLLQRHKEKYGPQCKDDPNELQREYDTLRAEHAKLDQEIAPIAKAASELNNPLWGLLMRAGNDKSKLASRVERYADIYTSRVSNFLFATPFVYFRSPRGSLPHDP